MNKEKHDSFDIEVSFEIMGAEETNPTLIVTPVKSSNNFETIDELIQENPKMINIQINENGIYVYSNDE